MLTMKKKLIYWFTKVEIKITSISAPRQIDFETYAGNARVFPCIEFFATKGERQTDKWTPDQCLTLSAMKKGSIKILQTKNK